MQFRETQLTYCLNVHPARSLADVLANLERFVLPVKRLVCPDRPFGVGLWLPAAAARELRRDLGPCRDLLARLGLYVFTLNGFPCGVFHGQAVKRQVYVPHWGQRERLDFTLDLIAILGELLPPGLTGSISTVPLGYGKGFPAGAAEHLLTAARAAAELEQRQGKRLCLALEPEPDCYLETTPGTIAFLRRLHEREPALRPYLGMCLDTCHLRLQGEDLRHSLQELGAAGVPVGKVQLSAALRFDNRQGLAPEHLGAYDEPVYLHQTRVQGPHGGHRRFADLGPALRANPRGEWLVHFHVPLHFAGSGELGSTADALGPDFLAAAAAACPNLEIETYTFGVLPQAGDVVASIAAEFAWLGARPWA